MTLGNECKLEAQVLMIGPLRAGNSNTFDLRSVLGKVDENCGGDIRIGHNCFFAASSTVFQPRGVLLPAWREKVSTDQDPQPSVTSIGNHVFISMGVGVCHDCIVEDNCSLSGLLAGYCHVMKGARTSPQSILHQFTTLGQGAFVTMSVKVAADILPHTVVNSDGKCLVDGLGLARAGINIEGARELEDFYRNHFSMPAATSVRFLEKEMQAEVEGRWFEKAISKFFEVRNTMRDMRPLHLVTNG